MRSPVAPRKPAMSIVSTKNTQLYSAGVIVSRSTMFLATKRAMIAFTNSISSAAANASVFEPNRNGRPCR